MRFHTEKKHIIDVIFPISLFFVFAASSLVVIILAANVYRNTTATSSQSFENRTAVSYLTEKVRQGDENGKISCGTFDGRDALLLQRSYGEQTYTTYIYQYNGYLRELFIQDGAKASADSGKEIMPVISFKPQSLSDHLIEFSCISSNGDSFKTTVSVKSEDE